MRLLTDMVRSFAMVWLMLVIVTMVGLAAAAWTEGPAFGMLVTVFAIGVVLLCLTGIDTARGQ